MQEKASVALLVLDLGLTNCKCIVFSPDGLILGKATVQYSTYYPAPGHVEQDPEEWWQAAIVGVRSLWDANPYLAGQIECISITGHMHALICMSNRGNLLGRALVLGDRRSSTVAADITAELELPTIYRITGARMDASMPAAKIRWLKEHAPDTHRSTSLFTGCKDFIRHRLTGDRLTDPIDACAMSLYDIQRGVWSPDLLRMAGVTEGQLPEVRKPTEIAGTLQEEAARALSLKAGIPVVVGGGDDIEVLGNGLMNPGSSLEHLGTTGSILTCADVPIYDPDMALEVYPHAKSGLWVLGGSITSAGSALDWAAKTLGYDSMVDTLSLLDGNSFEPRNPLLFLPHLLGERCPNWEPEVRGAWIGLTATHTASDLMKATFEGVAFALRSMLERIEGIVGEQRQISVAKSVTDDHDWLQIRANIYRRPVRVLSTSEPTALGGMILAAVGVGIYQDLYSAVENTCNFDLTVEPEKSTSPGYQKQFTNYQQASAALLPVWSSL